MKAKKPDTDIIEWVEKTVKVSSLKPYERNPRKINDQAFARLVENIKKNGYHQRILATDDLRVIGGHQRIKALEAIGMTTVKVLTPDRAIPDAQFRELLIKDNLPFGEFDAEMLALDFSPEELLEWGMPEEWMPDTTEATEGLTDEDAVPEPPAEPVTVLGDVWLLGNHRLMCGDSTSIDAVEQLMHGVKADMVFTDPPYGMKLDCDWSSAKSSLKFASDKSVLGGKKHNNVIGDHDDFTPDLINTVFASFPYCKEIFLWGADYYADLLPKKNDGSWIVWDKRLDESADKMYGSCFELCWSMSRHKREIARVKWAGIFGIKKEFDHKRHHPTQKPTALVEWFFEKWGETGNIVADLYLGSGSTLIACEKTGRACYGMELSPAYCDVICKRWQEFTGKEATHEQTGKRFNSGVHIPAAREADAGRVATRKQSKRDAPRALRGSNSKKA